MIFIRSSLWCPFRFRHNPRGGADAVAVASSRATNISTTTPTMDSSSLLIEEQKLQSEPKYRAYMANIDKALKNFEYSSEWADLISALGKLNKVSQVRDDGGCCGRTNAPRCVSDTIVWSIRRWCVWVKCV